MPFFDDTQFEQIVDGHSTFVQSRSQGCGCGKDRGGPAQLGIRDWAGLKGHGHDRNLACSLASEGRGESPRGRLGVTPAGTERQKVGFGRVRIDLIRTMEAMQLNAKKCHTKEGSMPVDIELVEVD